VQLSPRDFRVNSPPLSVSEDDRTYVEVHEGDQEFARRKVETGLTDGIYLGILSGLSPDESIRKL
jgi:HlyD family secretion protein